MYKWCEFAFYERQQPCELDANALSISTAASLFVSWRCPVICVCKLAVITDRTLRCSAVSVTWQRQSISPSSCFSHSSEMIFAIFFSPKFAASQVEMMSCRTKDLFCIEFRKYLFFMSEIVRGFLYHYLCKHDFKLYLIWWRDWEEVTF